MSCFILHQDRHHPSCEVKRQLIEFFVAIDNRFAMKVSAVQNGAIQRFLSPV